MNTKSIRYVANAAALQAFSATPLTRRLYRWLGNRLGGARRAHGQMPAYYAEHIRIMVRDGCVKDGDFILEVGTGWMHWEAIGLWLFYNLRGGVLFDVWDNRQLEALKQYLPQLVAAVRAWPELRVQAKARVQSRAESIMRCNSWDEVYALTDFCYVVEPSGSLLRFGPSMFDVVVSARVLEHLPKRDIPDFALSVSRILKPGGHSIHSISLYDHLSLSGNCGHIKEYLRFPDWLWNLCFDNQVQGINRVQRSEWLAAFERTGNMTLAADHSTYVDISTLRPSKRWAGYSKNDLRCDAAKLVHRKSP